jgi:hypothetical protein
VEAAVPKGIEPEDPESGNDDEEKILQMLRGGFDTTHVLERRARVTDLLADQEANAVGREANAEDQA